MTEKQILQEMIGLMYELKDSVFEYDLDNYNKENVEGTMEDFELEDMEDFLKKYPYMKYIPYGVIYDWQKFYNAEYLSAGWCGCCSPERLLEVLRDEKAAKENLK